jgi:hypothetical protein
MKPFILLLLAFFGTASAQTTFNANGIAIVNSKPFFPIGIWVYNLNPDTLAEIKAHHFNTLIGNGFNVEQLDVLQKNNLMGVPMASAEAMKFKSHPALLAWYLTDEPESIGQSVEQTHKLYKSLKKLDPNHPFGLDHSSLDAYAKFNDSCDFTMSDVYPITKDRNFPTTHVGLYVDEARRVHPQPNWAHWSFIQTFGGPNTDNGTWVVPTPDEVRCMTFMALIHRATGINYFSYWPQEKETWASVSKVNEDVQRLIPWLIAEGVEDPIKSSNPSVQVRQRRVGKAVIRIAVNCERHAVETVFESPGAKTSEHFAPLEVKLSVRNP